MVAAHGGKSGASCANPTPSPPDDAARAFGDIAEPDLDARMQLATPEFIGERLIAGMSGIVAAADAVLRKSAGKDEPPTQEAIEQWLADGRLPARGPRRRGAPAGGPVGRPRDVDRDIGHEAAVIGGGWHCLKRSTPPERPLGLSEICPCCLCNVPAFLSLHTHTLTESYLRLRSGRDQILCERLFFHSLPSTPTRGGAVLDAAQGGYNIGWLKRLWSL